MSVKLRKKELASGKVSLYLDVYNGHRHYEFLKLYLYKRPKDQLRKQQNKETLQLAEGIRAKRELQLQADEHQLPTSSRSKANFLKWLQHYRESYPKRDVRTVKNTLKYFERFVEERGYNGTLTPKDVTEELCEQFRGYLEQHLNGETPFNYFKRFKKALKVATKERLLPFNPAADVKNHNPEGLKKDVLSLEEVSLLAAAECGNGDVKRAFLFSLNTGLRYSDVRELRWKDIDGKQLRLLQQKTKRQVIIDLNPTALKLIGERGAGPANVFTLPSHNACLKNLRNWCKRAGIDKHITWHCARHSFAVNLLCLNTDIRTVSGLLGHSSLRETEKYTRLVDELKERAVNRLPELSL